MKYINIKTMSVVLALYVGAILMVQFFDMHREAYRALSLPQLFERQAMLAALTNDVARDGACIPLSVYCRNLAQALPENARIYMTNMLGPENAGKCGYLYFMRYYLFPREVAIALNQTARHTSKGATGIPAESDSQLRAAGYDIVVDFPQTGDPQARYLHALPPPDPPDPPLVGSGNAIIALLLPLLVAFMGMRVLKLTLPDLACRMNVGECLSCGFGIGMMIVASLALWVKLTDVFSLWVVPALAAAVSMAEIWMCRRELVAFFRQNAGGVAWHPVFVIIALVVVLFFRLACLEGLAEYDAVAGWVMKARLIYLSAGDNLVQWFSDPTMAQAHLDYPILVPTLHAVTWSALGRVNEFVTKCWAVWQLVFLLLGVACAVGAEGCRKGACYWLAAIVLLPVTSLYVGWEGATMPMIFFTSLAMSQFVVALQEQDRARLYLGMLLAVGSAMTKFEGMIDCGLMVAGAVVGFGFVRRGVSPHWWRVLVVGAISVSAFAWLRLHIPVLHYESHWMGCAIHNLEATMIYWPQFIMMMLGTFFCNSEFVSWTAVDGHLAWAGVWRGAGSLINQPTLGLAWMAVALTACAWFAVPGARRIILSVLAVVLGVVAVLAFVFSAIGAGEGLAASLPGISDETSGRYLLPVVMGWGTAMICIAFRREAFSAGQKTRIQTEKDR